MILFTEGTALLEAAVRVDASSSAGGDVALLARATAVPGGSIDTRPAAAGAAVGYIIVIAEDIATASGAAPVLKAEAASGGMRSGLVALIARDANTSIK